MSLRHAITRTVVAVPMGAMALGEAKDPGYMSNVIAELALDHSAIEGAGNLMTQHQNPTVAFLGLMATAIAVNHGPLFSFKTAKKYFTGKNPFRRSPSAQKAVGAQMKVANKSGQSGLTRDEVGLDRWEILTGEAAKRIASDPRNAEDYEGLDLTERLEEEEQPSTTLPVEIPHAPVQPPYSTPTIVPEEVPTWSHVDMTRN